MTYLANRDFMLEVAKGNIRDHTAVNKFGRTENADSGVLTDVWDRANSAQDQAIWVAPTEARAHTIVSTSASDVSSVATLTLAANASNNDTVTIDAKVYTFQTTLLDQNGNVLIGASASASIDNLIAAINLAAGAGTTYANVTTGNPTVVTALAGAGDTMTLYVATAGAIATTETGAQMSWGGAVAVEGASARTLRVYGLTDWDTAEVSEDINLKGVTGVVTANSYVIIHRMKVLTKGATSTNAGIITATALTDGSVTAHIKALEGQTQMAIYGVPSIQDAYMTNYHGSLNKNVKTAGANIHLLVNPEPDVELTNFLVKHTKGLVSVGVGDNDNQFKPYTKYSGPCIIKIQVLTDTADCDVDAGFDLILVENT